MLLSHFIGLDLIWPVLTSPIHAFITIYLGQNIILTTFLNI